MKRLQIDIPKNIYGTVFTNIFRNNIIIQHNLEWFELSLSISDLYLGASQYPSMNIHEGYIPLTIDNFLLSLLE